eukprot:TRINITY_DN23405_c0_g1_i1.p1 TRINITY_DN23405_c0_g1~~TRINITY_DN23405_c0_g1_i1.p1  ORF type:complete len:157 (+),score=31.41 TRINITY_DN23405_c0_g1_i1:86-556(+)
MATGAISNRQQDDIVDTGDLTSDLLTETQSELLRALADALTDATVDAEQPKESSHAADFNILDYEACYARWGAIVDADELSYAKRLGPAISSDLLARWEWMGDFRKLCGTAYAEMNAQLAEFSALKSQCAEVLRRTSTLREQCELKVELPCHALAS